MFCNLNKKPFIHSSVCTRTLHHLNQVRLTCCDETLLVLVVNTERLLQLLLESLVILLHQELGSKLTKLTKLKKTRP